jgi:hypothetical protein
MAPKRPIRPIFCPKTAQRWVRIWVRSKVTSFVFNNVVASFLIFSHFLLPQSSHRISLASLPHNSTTRMVHSRKHISLYLADAFPPNFELRANWLRTWVGSPSTSFVFNKPWRIGTCDPLAPFILLEKPAFFGISD